MVKLYELSAEYASASALLSDLDLTEEEIGTALEALTGALREKAINVARVFQNMEATVAAMKDAEKRMLHRRRMAEGRIARMRGYLLENMVAAGITAIDGPEFALKVAKNPPKVIIDDEDLIPADFCRVVTQTKIDKATIKKAIIDGQAVSGAHLEHTNRLAIK